MYNEQLEKLIDLALADGVLTEKEKQILFKKAESLGIDLDEFEMVLDAKLHEKQQLQPKQTEVTPKSNKFGDIKKCPACGAVIESFDIKCSDCGIEFRNVKKNGSINKLFKLLNNAKEEKREQIITTFPIPNTKEDIVEFLSLALPKATIEEDNELLYAWKAKCEQVMIKARFLLKNDPKTLGEIEKMYSIEKRKKEKRKKREIIIGSIISVFIITLIGAIYIHSLNVKELEKQVEKYIETNQFKKAEELVISTDVYMEERDLISLKSKIQLKKLTNKIDELEKIINEKNYSEISYKFKKIIWKKNSTGPYEDIERNSYNIFLKRQKALNDKLPSKYKIKIKDEFASWTDIFH